MATMLACGSPLRPLRSSVTPYICHEEEKSIDRVKEWIAQQHKFTGLPPPEEEGVLLRSQSTADINSKTLDTNHLNDCFPSYPSEDETIRFSGLEINRYYSPNMTRRRAYVPQSDPSLSNAQYGVGKNCSNSTLLPRPLDNRDIWDSMVASSPRVSPVAWSPCNQYHYRAGEGNTFPRRNKMNNIYEKRNLFVSHIMDQNLDHIKPSCPEEQCSLMKQFSPPKLNDECFISTCYDERNISPNQYKYNSREQGNSKSTESPVDDEATTSSKSPGIPSFSSNGFKLDIQDVKTVEKTGSFIAAMSLDTQRLLTGNLPDVALTAAKAIHKRELSDSLPKYKPIYEQKTLDTVSKCKGAFKSFSHHIRMSSAPERSSTNFNDKKKLLTNDKQSESCDVHKVKAFSWPKRATLTSNRDVLEKRTLADSSFNTKEKNEWIKTEAIENDNNCVRSSDSDTSEPPVRPPLPAQMLYGEKKFVKARTLPNDNPDKKNCDTPSSSRNMEMRPALDSISLDKSSLVDMQIKCSPDKIISSDEVHLQRCSVTVASDEVHLKRSIGSTVSSEDVRYKPCVRRIDGLSPMSGSSGKNHVPSHHYSNVKYICGKELSTDCTMPAFCSASTELTRNVSMSLKDLIRIHEQEIARVSGGNITRNESIHEKYRNLSIAESKARSKSVWKRHTTIGLLSHFNGCNFEKDILDFKTIDKAPLTPFTCSEAVSSSSFLYSESHQTDKISPPYTPTSPTTSLGNGSRKRNGPCVLPKPVLKSMNSVTVDCGRSRSSEIIQLNTSKIYVSSSCKGSSKTTSPIFKYQEPTKSLLTSKGSPKSDSISALSSPELKGSQSPLSSSYGGSMNSTLFPSYEVASISLQSNKLLIKSSHKVASEPSYKDMCIQTDLSLIDLHENEIYEALAYVSNRKELEKKYEEEKLLMQRKFEEQKKVANAYQKLEDRYRRKVYELQKALHKCTCARGKINSAQLNDSSYSSCVGISCDNHDISVQKVDGILHQLEAWLNNQTNGMTTDTSEISSFIGSNDDTCSRYRAPPEHYMSPPLEIIDKIDATSV